MRCAERRALHPKRPLCGGGARRSVLELMRSAIVDPGRCAYRFWALELMTCTLLPTATVMLSAPRSTVLVLVFAAQAHAFLSPALPRVAGVHSQARGMGIAMRAPRMPLLGRTNCVKGAGITAPASLMQCSRSSGLVQLRSSEAGTPRVPD